MSNFNLNIKNLSSNKSKLSINPNLHQQPKKILLSGNGSNNQLNQPNKTLDLTNKYNKKIINPFQLKKKNNESLNNSKQAVVPLKQNVKDTDSNETKEKQNTNKLEKPIPNTNKKIEPKYPDQIKIKTQITSNYLFHYAHFICDFLFPLICENLQNSNIIREKNLNQTIGNFDKLLVEVTNKKYEEVETEIYNGKKIKEIELPLKENYNKKHYLYFQKFMWDKFVVNNEKLSKVIWPEVILIKRTSQQIINIDEFNKKGYPHRTNNGSQRREIAEFPKIEKFMKSKYGDKMKTISLEDSSIENQVNLFYNAKLIVAAHGAALINLFYCRPGTTIIETIGLPWYFFDSISANLGLRHIKCDNKLDSIVNNINSFNFR